MRSSRIKSNKKVRSLALKTRVKHSKRKTLRRMRRPSRKRTRRARIKRTKQILGGGDSEADVVPPTTDDGGDSGVVYRPPISLKRVVSTGDEGNSPPPPIACFVINATEEEDLFTSATFAAKPLVYLSVNSEEKSLTFVSAGWAHQKPEWDSWVDLKYMNVEKMGGERQEVDFRLTKQPRPGREGRCVQITLHFYGSKVGPPSVYGVTLEQRLRHKLIICLSAKDMDRFKALMISLGLSEST